MLQPGRNTIRFFYCILLSAFMWLFISMNQEHDYTVPVSVEYALSSDKINNTILPNQVELEVTANGWKLLRIISMKQTVQIEAKENTERFIYKMNDNKDKFYEKLPPGINIHTVKPDSLSFQIENKLRKKVPVLMHTNFTFAAGFDKISEVEIIPDSIIIEGPESVIEKYNVWQTDQVNKKNINKNIEGTIALERRIDENIRTSAIAVRYSLQVNKFSPLVKTIALKNNISHGFDFSPDTIILQLSVPISYKQEIADSNFIFSIDFEHPQAEGFAVNIKSKDFSIKIDSVIPAFINKIK